MRHDLEPYVRVMHSELMSFLAKDQVESWYQEADRDRRLREAGLLGSPSWARLALGVWRRARSLGNRPGTPMLRFRGSTNKEVLMPLYMDVHQQLPDGASAADVAAAHQADLDIQDKYGVNYRSYWVAEGEGQAFCLVEAPNAAAAATVHREAHGLVADQIMEVTQG